MVVLSIGGFVSLTVLNVVVGMVVVVVVCVVVGSVVVVFVVVVVKVVVVGSVVVVVVVGTTCIIVVASGVFVLDLPSSGILLARTLLDCVVLGLVTAFKSELSLVCEKRDILFFVDFRLRMTEKVSLDIRV